MKFALIFALSLGMGAVALGATSTSPLLTKVEYSGFVQTGFQQSSTCEIYSDRVVITTTLAGAGLQTRELKAVKVNSAQLTGLLKKAYLGQVQEKAGPVDGPTTVLSGNLVTDSGATVQVILSENNGGSGKVRKNVTSEADVLIFAVNRICK